MGVYGVLAAEIACSRGGRGGAAPAPHASLRSLQRSCILLYNYYMDVQTNTKGEHDMMSDDERAAYGALCPGDIVWLLWAHDRGAKEVLFVDGPNGGYLWVKLDTGELETGEWTYWDEHDEHPVNTDKVCALVCAEGSNVDEREWAKLVLEHDTPDEVKFVRDTCVIGFYAAG